MHLRVDTSAGAADELFVDADQHGPRSLHLLARVVPALAATALMLLLAGSAPWRGAIGRAAPDVWAGPLLVVPVLVGLVLVAAAAAPMARWSALRLLGGAVLLLAGASMLTLRGDVVAASLPAAAGGTLLGLAGARAVRRAVWVLPVLAAAGISDAGSVHGGLTRSLVDRAAAGAGSPGVDGSVVGPVRTLSDRAVERLDLVVLHIPSAQGLWLIGIVDVAAVALLLGLCHLYWLPAGRTVVAFVAVVAATAVAGAPIAVLPLLGAAWVAVNGRLVWRSTRFSLRRLMYQGG